jgi:hypothetical protein
MQFHSYIYVPPSLSSTSTLGSWGRPSKRTTWNVGWSRARGCVVVCVCVVCSRICAVYIVHRVYIVNSYVYKYRVCMHISAVAQSQSILRLLLLLLRHPNVFWGVFFVLARRQQVIAIVFRSGCTYYNIIHRHTQNLKNPARTRASERDTHRPLTPSFSSPSPFAALQSKQQLHARTCSRPRSLQNCAASISDQSPSHSQAQHKFHPSSRSITYLSKYLDRHTCVPTDSDRPLRPMPESRPQ